MWLGRFKTTYILSLIIEFFSLNVLFIKYVIQGVAIGQMLILDDMGEGGSPKRTKLDEVIN